MSIYAKTSGVSIERSKAAIEKTLSRYGASHFAYQTDHQKAIIAFAYKGMAIKLKLILPNPDNYQTTPSGRKRRSNEDMLAAWEQACRSNWRALHLVILAKLEAVESGIAAFEDEFMAYTYLPNGRTVSEEILPQINKAIETGKMSNLILTGLTP
ncbi:MAG: hypothetical protein PHG53_09670 [Phycisphaerae bacterium]|nr:hypothetical protein [Phycisphaerae bacterium]